MKFRTVLFWLHLVAGVVAGTVIGVMSFTGAVLAFEKEIIAWSEREARHVTPPEWEPKRLPLDVLLAKVREAQPEIRYGSLTVFADQTLAVLFSAGRTNSAYVNPYTGGVSPSGSPQVRRFLLAMNDWHRWLGCDGDGRAVGRAITGACNAAFLGLAITGLYLWWPRKWTGAALRSVSVPTVRLRGKARDWNWHHAVGLWSAPVLIVLTVTALPMSYRWAGDAVYIFTGNPVPVQGGPSGAAGPAVEVPTPAPGSKRLSYAALLAEAQKQSANWEQITIRLAGAGSRGGGGGGGENRGNRENGSRPRENAGAAKPAGENARPADITAKERSGSEERRGPQAVSISIRERGGWPRFTTRQLSLDPFTGAVLRAEAFADYNSGRKARSWMRFLHTGEALGVVGQTVAALACLGGLVLVWTGFALAARRLAVAWSRRRSIPGGSVDRGVAPD
ncbi:MAG TPA: PepSY-associated TM helix domain-containing protein [Candidatus Limnocylindria bacterium]|nr:PepSY-associated TM helix domain-containing protein [Candidatus Limnocylindria bacterium]